MGVYWHLFPTRAEAKDAVWRDPAMLFNILPRDLVYKTNEVDNIVYFKNGSVYQLKGADDPDYLRGAGPVGLILDEFEEMKYEAWGVLEPILRANGGWAWFIGTPKGKNHLYTFYQRGLNPEFKNEWNSWLLPASKSGIIPADQLKEARRTAISENFYNQEWECAFLEGEGSVFRNVKDIMTAEIKSPDPKHMYVMGVDLAKVQDYTVITVYDRYNNEQVYQDRFKDYEWPFQKKKIKSISDLYNKALIVLDSTGLGDPIADDLMRAMVPVLAYKISEPTKKDLIEKLSIWIDEKRFKMLPIEDTLFEFENFGYTIGPTGKFRYGAPNGFHDDIVISHALAIFSLQPLLIQKKVTPPNIIQLDYMRQKLNYGQEDDQKNWDEWSEI